MHPVQLTAGSVAIGGRPVLRGIDLTVETGEFVALMGANGSGKTTLVRALTGLLPLASGELRLFGTPFAEYDAWSRIGFVPQRPGASSGVPTSVWEVVASGRLTRRRLLRPLSRADRAAIDHALEVVGLPDRRHERVTSLSGGQQQRVLIARALAGEPDLFVLDEPTAGVDLPSQQALADALGRLKAAGATVVLVAHELGPLAPLVDRAVVMRDGRITYDGPPLADHEVHHPSFGDPHTHHHHTDGRRRPGTTTPRTSTCPWTADELHRLLGAALPRLHAAGAAGRGVHRARGPGRRHVPRAAPALADGRRHRPRRGHRRRPRADHRHLPHLDRGGGRDARRDRDRADPQPRAHQRRRGAGPDVLRRPGRRRPAHRPRQPEHVAAADLPLRLDHHHLPDRRVGHHRARGRGDRGVRRAVAAAVRGVARPGVRAGGRSPGDAPTTWRSPCSPRSRSPWRCVPSACCSSRP